MKYCNSIIQVGCVLLLYLSFLLSSSTAASKNFDTKDKTLRRRGSDRQTWVSRKQGDELYGTYKKLYGNISLFRSKAKKAGIKVSAGEIEKRASIYKQLYPNNTIHIRRIEIQLMVEKYFRQKGELKVPIQEMENSYNRISLVRGEDLPPLEEMKEALQAEIFFNSQDFLVKKEKQVDLNYIKREGNSRTGTLSIEKLLLEGSPDICIVEDRKDNTCFVTIKEFNAKVLLDMVSFPKSLDITFARKTILHSYISEKYLSLKAQQDGFTFNPDSLLNNFKKQRKDSENYQKAKAFGLPVKNKKILWETYKKYYKMLFKPYDVAIMQIIGSSDSLFIDSLHKQLVRLEIEKKKEAGDKKTKLKYRKKNLPWRTIQEDKLAWVLVAPTMKFKEGQFSLPIKSKFGFFISVVKEIRSIPKISFEEALSHCQYLATREKFLKMDSVVEAKSLAYYRKHKNKFLTPDTLELKAWLAPASTKKCEKIKDFLTSDTLKPKTPISTKKPVNIHEIITKDTNRYKAMTLSSLSLPESTRDKLEILLKKGRNKVFYGPIKDLFGNWYFKLISSNVGKRQIPFYRVKQEIIDIIAPIRNIKETAVPELLKNELLLTESIVKAYKRKKINEINSLPDSVILSDSVALEILGATSNPSDRELTYAINKAKGQLKVDHVTKDRRNINEFLKTIEIATDILKQ